MTNYWGGEFSKKGNSDLGEAEYFSKPKKTNIEEVRSEMSKEDLRLAADAVDAGAFICLLENTDLSDCSFFKVRDDLFEIVHKSRIIGYAKSEDIRTRK